MTYKSAWRRTLRKKRPPGESRQEFIDSTLVSTRTWSFDILSNQAESIGRIRPGRAAIRTFAQRAPSGGSPSPAPKGRPSRRENERATGRCLCFEAFTIHVPATTPCHASRAVSSSDTNHERRSASCTASGTQSVINPSNAYSDGLSVSWSPSCPSLSWSP